MRLFGIAVFVVCSSICAAQSTAGGTLQRSSLEAISSDACPIGVEARQHGAAPLLLADTGGAVVHPVYSIAFQPSQKPIREVAVELVGPTGPHVEQVNGLTAQGSESAVERFTLAKLNNPHVATAHLTAVAWVEVVRVAYADGTAWHRGPKTCRVSPNHVLPVSQATRLQ